jgi:hypothetical protein
MQRRPVVCLLFHCFGYVMLVALAAVTFPASPAEATTTVVVQHSGQCLDVRGGPQATQDGARIEQWPCTGATNQSWTLQDAGNSQFRLVALNSSKCVDTISGGTAAGTGLHQMPCTTAASQLWTRRYSPTVGAYSLVHGPSNLCLAVPNSSSVEGEYLALASCSDGTNQRWRVSATENPPPAQRVIAKHSGRCLDVRGGPQATQDGARIEQWTCTGATNQSWTLRDSGSNQFQLVALNSGKCIETLSGGTANGTGLQQLSCGTSAAQLWSIQSSAVAGEYRLLHSVSGRCLTVPNGELNDGTLLTLSDCTASANQTWTLGTSATSTPPTVEQRNGEYWELPSTYPAKSPHGGLYQIWGSAIRWSPTTDMHWVGAYWRDLNPTEGQYRWDRIEPISTSSRYGLDELGARNGSAVIWTAIGTRDSGLGVFHAPDWVRTKCAAEGTPITVINNGSNPWGLALWEPCPRRELLRFITQMFSRYKTDPRVAYAYVTTFNAGEFWMPAAVYDDAVSKGFSNEILRSYAKDVIDAWVTALGAKKLIWTSAGGWTRPGDGPDWVNNYALNTLGTQMREGNAESVSVQLNQPLIGQGLVTVSPTPIGATAGQSHYYLTADTIQNMGREGMSFYGNEFEIADLAGVFDNYRYYRMTVLNMLRRGHNWAIFPHDLRSGAQDSAHPEFAVLRDYFRQSAGYPVNESPDAWAMLQMFYDGCYNGTRRYHNYEKFMVQRDVEPGGRTTLVEQHTWAPDHYGFCKVGEGGSTQAAVTYFARRTDRATGNDYIYFNVDDEFAATTARRFKVAVYYRNVGTASWRVEYSTTSAATVATPSVTNTNDGTWKTAIFTLTDVALRNAQTGGMDFRIYNGGSADVTVGGVRVIRGGS